MVVGVLPAAMNEEAPVWSDLNNVVIEAAGLGRPLGAELIESVAEDVSYILQMKATAGPRAFISGDTGTWMYDGTDITAVTPFPFTTGGKPTLESWGTWCLGTNNLDPPKVWKNGGAFVNLGITNGNFTKCKQFIRRQPYVLALSTDTTLAGDTTAGCRVRWCSDDNVEMWEVKPENTAGDFEIRDITGEIRGGCPIGDSVAIYSDEAVTMATYIGPPYVFSFVTTLRGFGIYAPKSVCAVGRLNYGIGPQGIFQTDGYSFQLLGDDNFRKWLKDLIDETKRDQIVVFHNEFTDTVHFHFPVKGTSNWSALYWKLDVNKFTTGDVRCNAAVEREVFNVPLVAVGKDICRLTRDVQDWDGQTVISTIKTKWTDCETNGYDKWLDHVFLNGFLDNVDIEVWAEDIDQNQWEVYRKQDAARQNFVLQEAHKFQLTLTAPDDFHLSRVRFMGEVGAMSL